VTGRSILFDKKVDIVCNEGLYGDLQIAFLLQIFPEDSQYAWITRALACACKQKDKKCH